MIRDIFTSFMYMSHMVLSFCYKLFHMELTEESWNRWCSFIKFLFVGLCNTILLFTVYYLIMFLAGTGSYLWAQTAGYAAGIVNSYFWNSRYVFREGKRGYGSFLRMCMSYAITYVIQMLLLFVQVDLLHISEFIAPVAAVMITTPINYVLNKFFAFHAISEQ